MDLRVRFEDGSYCAIEIQLEPLQNANERFVYYLADAYSRQLERGEKYKEIQKETAAWDKALLKSHPSVANATNKKSIMLLRKTNYSILPIGSFVLKLVKGY